MTQHLVEIEEHLIPVGHEVVRVGNPKQGEKYTTNAREIAVASHDMQMPYIIVREKWTPGMITLKPGLVAMDKCGDWYWYSGKPYLDSGDWLAAGFDMWGLNHLNWTPPPCTGPEDSLREIK